MSDRVVDQIVRFVSSKTFLREDVAVEVKRRVLDSVGCFFGAFHEGVSKASRQAASRHEAKTSGAALWLTGMKTTPEWACFVNAVGVRALDFNDTYLSKEPLHPSDMIPALVAVGEACGSSGRELVEAIAVAYEVGCRLCDAASLRRRGWDHVNFTMVGAVAGVGKLMTLDEERLANALSLAVIPHAAMRQTRAGELSMWKGAAAANACRNAVFACMLAENGMTGPSQPFEGEMGFFRQVSGEPFTLDTLTPGKPPEMVLKTYLKYHPVEYHAMTAVDAALKIRHEAHPADIAEVRVDTFEASYTILAKDPEKWRPATRETADHSLPYIVAATLLDGGVWLDSFTDERISREDIKQFINRVKVYEDPVLTTKYPEELPNRVSVVLRDGRRLEASEAIPRGHYKNPMTDEEVKTKFNRLSARLLDEEQRKRVFEVVERLDRLGSVSELVEVLVVG